MDEKNPYYLRNLEADDAFLVVSVINKIGLKELKGCVKAPEVRAAIKSGIDGNDVDLSAVGVTVMMEIACVILEHLPECKREIYALLAALSGMKESEIAKLPFKTFIRMVKDVIGKQEFADFF